MEGGKRPKQNDGNCFVPHKVIKFKITNSRTKYKSWVLITLNHFKSEYNRPYVIVRRNIALNVIGVIILRSGSGMYLIHQGDGFLWWMSLGEFLLTKGLRSIV